MDQRCEVNNTDNSAKELHVVIGLGATGQSCLRFLTQHPIPVVAMDTRIEPPCLEDLRREYPQVPIYTGNLLPSLLNQAKTIIVSPGIPLSTPALVQAQAQGAELIGDIELFARYNTVPVIAITAANGKSTVTSLVGEMARQAGKNVAVLGNIGTPALSLFDQAQLPDLIVLELSSFQLETTSHLRSLASTVLNITPDHLDRYDTFNDYVQAKHRIYQGTAHAIINKQDPLSHSATIPSEAKRIFFTLDVPSEGEFGLREKDQQRWLAKGETLLLPVSSLKIMGEHNLANALSALALGSAAGLEEAAMLKALTLFTGLSHRCQWVAQKEAITWINDSKGTNMGACQAAIAGVGAQLKGKIVLLLGGDGKGADFSDLAPYVQQYCRAIIAMGKDASQILQTLGTIVPSHFAATMDEAVILAQQCAQAGDTVLLSPACSSLDQYRDFAHRGDEFMRAVQTVHRHCHE